MSVFISGSQQITMSKSLQSPVAKLHRHFGVRHRNSIALIARPRTCHLARLIKDRRLHHNLKNCSQIVVHALWGFGENKNKDQPSSRQRSLLDFVSNISPSSETSSFDVPAPVLTAMRQTTSNLLGTLPPQFFRITIQTRNDNLAQLMFSVLMTGYMFCNAYYRMQLSQSLNSLTPTALISATSSTDIDSDSSSIGNEYLAAGSQKLDINGSVLKWHYEDGVQTIPAHEYIDQLEQELLLLKQQLEEHKSISYAKNTATTPASSSYAHTNTMPNDLLDFLKTLTTENISEFTSSTSPGVLEAMNVLVKRMIGNDDADDEGDWRRGRHECTATELAQLLFWLMKVGHQLRDLEMRASMYTSLIESTSSAQHVVSSSTDVDVGRQSFLETDDEI